MSQQLCIESRRSLSHSDLVTVASWFTTNDTTPQSVPSSENRVVSLSGILRSHADTDCIIALPMMERHACAESH